MGRLTVLLTSPRLPPGLLTPDAWQAPRAGGRDRHAPIGPAPLASSLTSAGFEVIERPDVDRGPRSSALAADRDVVWLAADDGDPALTAELAASRRTTRPRAGDARATVEVEIVVGVLRPGSAPGCSTRSTVMDTLRRECPWDREQTHESLVPYLVEEAYEVIEAIETLETERGPTAARGARRPAAAGALPCPAGRRGPGCARSRSTTWRRGLVEKLVRRHPHVFADTEVTGAADVDGNWEQIKRAEKGRTSAVDGHPGRPARAEPRRQRDRPRAAVKSRRSSVPVPDGETGLHARRPSGEVLFALVAAARAAGLDAGAGAAGPGTPRDRRHPRRRPHPA